MAKGVRQASKASSFVEASEDMRELAEIEISPTHLQRLSERVGEEWEELRDEDVEKFRERRLERDYKEPPRGAVAVMLDGGRVQTRADDAGRGVSEPGWRESKVACCLTIDDEAPCRGPSARTAREVPGAYECRTIGGGGEASQPAGDRAECGGSSGEPGDEEKGGKEVQEAKAGGKIPAGPHGRSHHGKQRDLRLAGGGGSASPRAGPGARKACVCDGQAYNWSIYEMHLLPAGFIAVLDFLHLLAYLHDAAYALGGADEARSWKTYKQWLRWAWSGKAGTLLSALREAVATLKAKGSTAAARRQTVEETLTYVNNNRQRMNYPEYRCLGLPVSSARRWNRRSSKSTAASRAAKNSGWRVARKRCSNFVPPNSVRTTAGNDTGRGPANTAAPPAPAASPRAYRAYKYGNGPGADLAQAICEEYA